jgi:hypothetical protein
MKKHGLRRLALNRETVMALGGNQFTGRRRRGPADEQPQYLHLSRPLGALYSDLLRNQLLVRLVGRRASRRRHLRDLTAREVYHLVQP